MGLCRLRGRSIRVSLIFLIAFYSIEAIAQSGQEDAIEEDTGFSVYNATANSNGVCVCHIEAPTDIHCTSINSRSDENSTPLIVLQEQVIELSIRVSQQVTFSQSQSVLITELSSTMMTTLNTLEQIAAGQIIITRPEYDVLRREIADMETLLLILRTNSTASTTIVVALQAEIENITAVLTLLEESESADTAQLMDDINGLRVRLIACQQDNDVDLFQSWIADVGDQDTCGTLVGVSDPYTVRGIATAKGTWFRDPVKNQHKVYVFILLNGRYSNSVNVYQSVTVFHNADVTVRIQLPVSADGPGMVAYNGSFYFNIYASRDMGRYNIALDQMTRVPLPSDTIHNNLAPYFSTAYSDIDFAVDESGLWVIYTTATAGGLIVVSKVDPDTLALTRTWTTSFRKQSTANCFIVCQVLYCTNGYESHSDKINYYYDTKTGTETFAHVTIDSKFGATYALDYNPYDQKLYGWDSGHLVVYDLAFESDEDISK